MHPTGDLALEFLPAVGFCREANICLVSIFRDIHAVAKHERMEAVLVPEIVEDAIFLHQPRHECECRFTALHAIFQYWIAIR